MIEPQLERLPGVATANVGGGKIRQIKVKVNRDLLQAKGISVTDVARVGQRLEPPAALRQPPLGDHDYNVFTNTQVSEVEPMENIVVRRRRRAPHDPGARRSAAWRTPRETQQSVVRVNGERGVYLRVLKQPGAQHHRRRRRGRAAAQAAAACPPNVKLAISFDQSTYIRQSVTASGTRPRTAALLAIFVILIFLRSLRATGIIAVAIPLSLMLTLVAMFMLGQTLNVFTLGGLALGVGRLVDDSIVELENIHRHLKIPGKARGRAVLDAAQEVAMPILVSTITTIVVFFPVLFLAGVARNLFMPLALTISFALFA